MWIGRDEDSTISLFIDKPHRYQDITWEWKSMDYTPLYLTEKKYREDGSYYYENNQMLLPEEIDKLTWDDEAVEVTIEADENGLMYLARDEDGSLHAFATKPYRNEVNPRWSGPDKLTIINHALFTLVAQPEEDMKSFDYLKWEDEPIKINFKIKGNC